MMRNPYISFLQAFGILLVVAGHAFPTDGHGNPVYQWIYSFHMPLWVFLSGYLLRYTAPLAAGDCPLSGIAIGTFTAKKARRLLIPYLLISTLVFVPKVWLSRWAVKPVELTWTAYVEMLLIPSKNVIVYYWFLPTIFILLTGAVAAAKLLGTIRANPRIPLWAWPLAALTLSVFNPLAGVEWLNLSGVIKFSFFFALGLAYCAYQGQIDRALYLGGPWTTIGWGSTSVLLAVTGYGMQNLLTTQLTAVCGILFALSLGHTCLQARFRLLEPLDGTTYAIFLFSWFPQSALRVLLYDQGHLSPWIGVPLSVAAGVGLPWLLWKGLQYGKRWKGGRIAAGLLGQ